MESSRSKSESAPADAARVVPAPQQGPTAPAPSNDEKVRNPDKPPPWWVFAVLLALAGILIAVYGWAVGSWAVLLIELLLAVASMVAGGLIGFLFGIPRILARTQRRSDTDAAGVTMDAPPWEPSNNLEQVAEWLTKIVVGVGLVEIRGLAGALAGLGAEIAKAQQAAGVAIVSQMVVVAFAVLGFMASYLWTRLDYQQLQAYADSDLRSKIRAIERGLSTQQKETANIEKVTDLIASGKLKVPSAMGPEREARKLASGESWPEELRSRIREFEETEYPYDSDPTGDLFRGTPRARKGRELQAQIVADLKRSLTIQLTVRRTDGPPLEAPVAFLLHPTFQDRVEWVTPKDGIATLTVYSEGTFTVVAIADEGATILAYPLETLPGAPSWFLDN